MFSKLLVAATVGTTAAASTPLSAQYVGHQHPQVLELRAAGTHYGNPFDGACEADEKNLTFAGGDAVCGAKCAIGKPCPKDVPAGMTAKPSCFHAEGIVTYCVTRCETAADCGTDHVDCNSNGECVYTGPSSGPKPSPAPAKPSPAPAKPGPSVKPSPAPAPSKQTHYGDPYDGPCLSGETNVSITGVAGAFCSPACGSGCPTDVPTGVTAKPTCALEPSGSTKPTQCALICSPSLPILDQDAADAQCGAKASCKPIQSSGVCTYDDGPAPPPAPAPSPKPPAPSPSPSACPTCTFTKLTIDPPPAVMIGVGTSSADSAYAAAGYSSGGSTILKTNDAGSTFSKIKTSNGTLLLLGTASLSKDKAFAAGLFSGEYTIDGGSDGSMKSSLLLGGGQSVEAFGDKSYGVVGGEQVATSDDSGIAFKEHKFAGIDTKTYPGRYGAYPSATTWYVSAGTFPSNSVTSGEGWETVFRRTERHEIRRNTTSGALFHHWHSMEDLKGFKDGQYAGAIYKTTDGGSTWTMLFSDVGNFYFNDIHCTDETHCIATAEAHATASPGAHVFTTVDGKTFFQSHFEAGEFSLSGARFVSSTEALVTGSDLGKAVHHGVVLQSLNGGFDWAHHDTEASMTGQDILDLACSAADSCYAASVTQLQSSELLVYKAAK